MELRQQLEKYDLVFLDLETTGLDPKKGDAICEVAAVKMQGRKVIDTFNSLVNPKRDIPQEAYRIHGISNEAVKDAPAFEELAHNFFKFINGCVIFAYNIEFDAGFLEHELAKIGLSLNQFPAIDILAMARKTLRLEKYNLLKVSSFFNIPYPKAHRALDDAQAASAVFFKITDILKEKQLIYLDDFITLYGLGNNLFRTREAIKVSAIQDTIAKQRSAIIRYFSHDNIIEEQEIKPTHLVKENDCLYLWCQSQRQNLWRVNTNRILGISIV